MFTYSPLHPFTLTLFCKIIPFSTTIGKCSTTSAEKLFNPNIPPSCIILSPDLNILTFLFPSLYVPSGKRFGV